MTVWYDTTAVFGDGDVVLGAVVVTVCVHVVLRGAAVYQWCCTNRMTHGGHHCLLIGSVSGVVPDWHGVTQNGSGSSSVTSPALVLVETPNESVCGGTVVSTKMNGLGRPGVTPAPPLPHHLQELYAEGRRLKGIQRSTETGLAVEMPSRTVRQASHESIEDSMNSYGSEGNLNYSGMCLASDAQFSDFLDGMGPAQFVGRQTLATTSMGDVEIGLMERNGQLEVEIIQARGLIMKPGSKGPPAAYIKVYLLENGICVAKKKTKSVRKSLDPLYNQVLVFSESPQGKVVQNSCTQKEVWDCSAIGKEDKGYQDPYLLAEGSDIKE
ncbi:hypothetical protein NFI96_007743 [Prochilodus magdalenae]|nr:hypothetical protein NFI96_007743 [Prochilodus magdalenae]